MNRTLTYTCLYTVLVMIITFVLLLSFVVLLEYHFEGEEDIHNFSHVLKVGLAFSLPGTFVTGLVFFIGYSIASLRVNTDYLSSKHKTIENK